MALAPALARPPALSLQGVPRLVVASLLILALIASVSLPLATYVSTLALFGMPHVIQELRYIRHRFGSWAGPWLIPVGLALAGICATRLVLTFGGLSSSWGRLIELGLVLVIVVCSAPLWARGAWPGRVAGGLAVLGLGVGLVFAPLLTLLAVAVLHNWTPLPFVLEAVRARERPFLLAVSAVVFVAAPLLIATGLPWMAVASLSLGAPDWSLIAAGSLAQQLPAYLPEPLVGWSGAQHVFSAIVFAQCTHYVLVLLVLPSLRGGPVGPLRTGAWTWLGILAAALISTAAFLVDFSFGRSFYGAFSSVHAWVELPLFLLVLTAGAWPTPSPTESP